MKSKSRLWRRRTELSIGAYGNVLGVGISAVNMKQAVLACDRLIADNGRGCVSLTGVHGVYEATARINQNIPLD
jgi:hypothetical protein